MGYGAINAVSCTVTESLNGEYELKMVMLNTDQQFSRIEIGSIIACKPNNTDPIQAFCVEEIGKAINGEVEIYATHIAQFRSKLIPVNNYTATSLSDAIDKAFTNSLEANPFTWTTDKSVSTNYTLDEPRSFRELMGGKEGSILDIYGGEYYYNNFDIQLLNHRGADNGVKIFYGKNMVTFKADDQFSWDNSATGVVPYWCSEQDGLVCGDAQYSDYADTYPFARTVVKDFSQELQTKPTKAELEAKALSWIKGKGLPYTNLSVSFDDLITDNNGKNIGMGDTVHIINSDYSVNYTSKIVSMTYNVLLERYDNIQVGDKKASINDAISDAASDVTINESREYSAGNGIDITNNVISSLLTAGSGIQISSNVISNTRSYSAGTGLSLSSGTFSVHFSDLTSINLNNVKYQYLGYVSSSTNYPSGTNADGVLISIFRDDGARGMQMYSPHGSTGTLYLRKYYNSTWTSWTTIK